MAALAGGCVSGDADVAAERGRTLTIGVPEGLVAGTDLGLQNLADSLSYEGLTQLGPDGRATPRLAESWAWEDDGLSLRIKLRPNIRLHDGTPLTASRAADEVRAAVTRGSNRVLFTSLRDIKEVRAAGDQELVIELSQRSAFLPEDLELPLRVGPNQTGTGPYRLTKEDPAELVMARFDDYHQGPPPIQSVTIKAFGPLRTAWASLLRGEVDMVWDVPPDAVQFVESETVDVISFGRRYQYLVAFNIRQPPFDSPTIRRALNFAIDRRRIVEGILRGRGNASTGPLWPKHWAYDSTVASFPFEPGVSLSLFEGAGFKANGSSGPVPNTRLRFRCLIPAGFTVLERIGLEVQRQLYNVGVDMQFEVVPAEEFNLRVRDGRFEAMLIDMISGPSFGRAYNFWGSAETVTGLNVFGYENAEAERLFGVLRTSTNEAAIRTATRSLQRVLLEDPPALFIAWNERSRAIRRDFGVTSEPDRDPIVSIWRWAPVGGAARPTPQ